MASINYNDSRFTELEKEEASAKKQSNSTYDNLISQSGKYYDNLVNQSKEWADKQAEIQNQQTEFAIDKIEQQKDLAKKDYTKEQKGAYQDYMKQSNAYGSNMQTAGQSGLGGSGWSETIQSGFYNTYQNRYAQARESYNTIVMNYDNNIKEAQLQNSSALATIYAQAQKEQLELALQNFTIIKDLSIAKQNAYIALDSEYNNRWRQVESQINTERALAEQKRQADMDNKYKQAALALEREQFNWQKAKAAGSGGGSGSTRLSSGSSKKSSSKSSSKKSSGAATTLAAGAAISASKSSSSSSKSSSKSSSGTVKLSNGKTGYSSAVTAYAKSGGTTPYSSKTLLNKGLVKSVNYNGKTYYYAK